MRELVQPFRLIDRCPRTSKAVSIRFLHPILRTPEVSSLKTLIKLAIDRRKYPFDLPAPASGFEELCEADCRSQFKETSFLGMRCSQSSAQAAFGFIAIADKEQFTPQSIQFGSEQASPLSPSASSMSCNASSVLPAIKCASAARASR